MRASWVIAVSLSAVLAAGAAAWATGYFPRITGVGAARQASGDAGQYPIRMTLPQARPFANKLEVVEALVVVSGDEEKSDFAEQMGIDPDDARMALPRPPGAPAATRSENGLLTLDFDLSRYGASAQADASGGTRDTKQLIVGGQKVGAIPLLIGDGATVSVDRQTLLSLVGERDPALAASLARVPGEQVTFEALRSRDVAIRYDPLADTVVIETKS